MHYLIGAEIVFAVPVEGYRVAFVGSDTGREAGGNVEDSSAVLVLLGHDFIRCRARWRG